MNRQEFIERLKELLGDLSEEERQEAIQYYEDYFADAGEENEERVIEELGSPEKVALMIREGLQGEDGGSEYRETGYAQTRYEEREVPQSRHSNEEREQSRNQKPWTSRPLKILLIILIICVGFPVVIPVIGGIVFGALGILCELFGIFFAFVIFSFGLCIAGVALVVSGIVAMFPALPVGLLISGIGMLLLAVGIIAAMASIKLSMVAVPALFRCFVNTGRRIFYRARG